MMSKIDLRENEAKVLSALKEAGGSLDVSEIVSKENLSHAAVMRAALSLESKNLIRIIEWKVRRVSLTEEGRLYAEIGLPERRLAQALIEMGGEACFDEALSIASIKSSTSAIA